MSVSLSLTNEPSNLKALIALHKVINKIRVAYWCSCQTPSMHPVGLIGCPDRRKTHWQPSVSIKQPTLLPIAHISNPNSRDKSKLFSVFHTYIEQQELQLSCPTGVDPSPQTWCLSLTCFLSSEIV